jgi:hypothetical protein
VLCEQPGPAGTAIASILGIQPPDAVDHTELFVHQLPPYASIYLSSQGKIGGEARDRIAGLWRALRMTPPLEPDHLAALLGLWATMIDTASKERDPARRLLSDHTRVAVVWEHVACWVVPYLARVTEVGNEPFPAWAVLLQTVIDHTLEHAGAEALPGHLAVEERPLDGPEDVVSYLLTPVRSGVILTKSDLYRAASHLEIGVCAWGKGPSPCGRCSTRTIGVWWRGWRRRRGVRPIDSTG